jgi:hypothetical protein
VTAPRSQYAVPGRITVALDARGLEGPEVDAACGVVEPVVDLWEAGVLLPTVGQVEKLAELTGMAAAFFYEMEPLPAGRTFICSRRKALRQVVEPGEVANPLCPGCGQVMWSRMPSATGPVLIERPDPIYGQMVVAVIGRVRQGRRSRAQWGVRPVRRGEMVEGHLRRRPHSCAAPGLLPGPVAEGAGGRFDAQ